MEYKFFEPNEQIDISIRNDDVTALISILVGIINRDQTFATTRFSEAETYIVKKLGKSLKTSYHQLPGEYSLPREKWNKEYYHILLVWLSDNYCDERIEQVKEVGREVYAKEFTWGKDESENFSRPTTIAVAEKKPNVVGIVVIGLVIVGTLIWVYFKMQM